MHMLLHHLCFFAVFSLSFPSIFLLLCQSIKLELETYLTVELELMLIVNDLEPSLLHAICPVDDRMIVVLGSAHIEGVAIMMSK